MSVAQAPRVGVTWPQFTIPSFELFIQTVLSARVTQGKPRASTVMRTALNVFEGETNLACDASQRCTMKLPEVPEAWFEMIQIESGDPPIPMSRALVPTCVQEPVQLLDVHVAFNRRRTVLVEVTAH